MKRERESVPLARSSVIFISNEEEMEIIMSRNDCWLIALTRKKVSIEWHYLAV